MMRLLIFVVTGIWWTPKVEIAHCLRSDCRAFAAAQCSSGFCLVHCADPKTCLCGVGRTAANELAVLS